MINVDIRLQRDCLTINWSDNSNKNNVSNSIYNNFNKNRKDNHETE